MTAKGHLVQTKSIFFCWLEKAKYVLFRQSIFWVYQIFEWNCSAIWWDQFIHEVTPLFYYRLFIRDLGLGHSNIGICMQSCRLNFFRQKESSIKRLLPIPTSAKASSILQIKEKEKSFKLFNDVCFQFHNPILLYLTKIWLRFIHSKMFAYRLS